MEDEAVDTRYEFEERNGRRLRYFAGKPGNYVGVTEYKGKHKTSFNARASITKRKGDARRQYAIGSFPTAVAAAMAIADAEQDPLGPPSPEGERKPRTCVLPAHATRPLIFCMYDTWLRLLLCSQPTNASSIALASTGPSSRRILPANKCSRGQWCSRHALPRSRCLLRAITIPPLSFRSSSSRGYSMLRPTPLLRPGTGGFLRTPWLQGCCAVAGAFDGRQDGALTGQTTLDPLS